ncbi:MAG: hypothetical protein HOW73_45465 [Polyangiaceae bacterium]|nr:hypothetical protein [Polyangiaceae bacterium]
MSDHPRFPPPRPSAHTTVGIGPEHPRGRLQVVPDPRRDDTPESPQSVVTEAARLKALEDGQAALITSLAALTKTNAEVRDLIGKALDSADNRVTGLENHVKALAGQWITELSKVNTRLDGLEARQKKTEEDAAAAKKAAEGAEDLVEETTKTRIADLERARADAERRASKGEELGEKLNEQALGIVVHRKKTTTSTVAQTAFRIFTSTVVLGAIAAIAMKWCGG